MPVPRRYNTINLTQFIFEKSGMLPKASEGILTARNTWKKNFSSKAVIKRSPYRPQKNNAVYKYGDNDIYAYSDAWRDLGHAMVIAKKREQMKKDVSYKNKNNHDAGLNEIERVTKESVPGKPLSPLIINTLFDVLQLPYNDNEQEGLTDWKSDGRHLSLISLPFHFSSGHFYTRNYSGTPARNQSCSLHSLSELLATMKMTSIEALITAINSEYGGKAEIKAIKEEINSGEDKKDLDAFTRSFEAECATLKAEEKELSVIDNELLQLQMQESIRESYTRAEDQMRSVIQNLIAEGKDFENDPVFLKYQKRATDIKDRMKSEKTPKLKTIQAEITEKQKRKEQLESKNIAAILTKITKKHEEKLDEKTIAWERKKAAIDTLSSLQEALDAGHQDLLSWHCVKLKASFKENGYDIKQENDLPDTVQLRKEAALMLGEVNSLLHRLENRDPIQSAEKKAAAAQAEEERKQQETEKADAAQTEVEPKQQKAEDTAEEESTEEQAAKTTTEETPSDPEKNLDPAKNSNSAENSKPNKKSFSNLKRIALPAVGAAIGYAGAIASGVSAGLLLAPTALAAGASPAAIAIFAVVLSLGVASLAAAITTTVYTHKNNLLAQKIKHDNNKKDGATPS